MDIGDGFAGREVPRRDSRDPVSDVPGGRLWANCGCGPHPILDHRPPASSG